MKKTLLNTSIVLMFGAASFVSNANDGMYWGGNLSSNRFSTNDENGDLSLKTFNGRIGKAFNENISLEARIGLGLGDDKTSLHYENHDENYDYISDETISFKLKNTFGLYLRAGFPINEYFAPYAILGYTQTRLEVNQRYNEEITKKGNSSTEFQSYSDTFSISESDTSLGLGTDIKINENMTLNLEYLNYLDKNGLKLNALSIGIAYKF